MKSESVEVVNEAFKFDNVLWTFPSVGLYIWDKHHPYLKENKLISKANVFMTCIIVCPMFWVMTRSSISSQLEKAWKSNLISSKFSYKGPLRLCNTLDRISSKVFISALQFTTHPSTILEWKFSEGRKMFKHICWIPLEYPRLNYSGFVTEKWGNIRHWPTAKLPFSKIKDGQEHEEYFI